MIDTGTANELPVRGAEIDWRYNFDPDDAFTVAVDFAQPGLEGTLKTIVVADDLPDYPLAQYALWLGEEDHVSYGKMTSQERPARAPRSPTHPTSRSTPANTRRTLL